MSTAHRTGGMLLVAVAVLLFVYGFGMATFAGQKAQEILTQAKSQVLAAANAQDKPPDALSKAVASRIKEQRKTDPLSSETQKLMRVTTEAGQFTLLAPMWLCIAAFFLLVAGAGLAAGGDAFWVLLDPNSRCTSLSRTQAVIWTAVVLGGYSALAFCNIAFGAGDAVSQTTPFSLFPDIDADLLLLLGIVAGSPVAAAYLSGEAATAGGVTPCPQAGAFARLAQIFQDDGPNGPGKLDLSRLQCVFMTLILVFAYTSLLTQVAGNITAQELLAPAGKVPLFAQLPPINGSFMVLLAASHTIFQVSKSKWGQQFSPQPANRGAQQVQPQPDQGGQAAGS
jgi:hypothetical protein